MGIFKIWFVGILHVPASLIAQTGSIKGSISDADTRSPLQYVNVDLPGKDSYSDALGNFLLNNIPVGKYELSISHIGYQTELRQVEVKENDAAEILVALRKSPLRLDEIKLAGNRSNSLSTIAAVDIKLRPLNNSQDILRIVPGLFIAQHAGGGKAEQIFLRGFDIDHGTDISITVDGMPVNMVSHAHGQGYADLHFVIPETVDKVDFAFGPYEVSRGNLATAGYVGFETKDFLAKNMIRLEAGRFKSFRGTTLLKLMDRSRQESRDQLYFAGEFMRTDGFVESPQDFHRLNFMTKYSFVKNDKSRLEIIASHFDSKWNASGQIPDRAVKNGLITRFGSIDNTEGGSTRRSNISARHSKKWNRGWETNDQVYLVKYQFDLFSNFTFFLVDSVNGDQIRQKEKRTTWGYQGELKKSWYNGNNNSETTVGYGFRHDQVNGIELSNAVQRKVSSPIQQGDIRETNAFVYVRHMIELRKRLSLAAGLRFDQFSFRYRNILLNESGFQKQQKGIVNPKLSLNYSASRNVKLFLNAGTGFHSNDSRVILSSEADRILPKAFGVDLGTTVRAGKKLLLKPVLWFLHSDQEFVYVGDAGIIEPGGKTVRMGIDLSARYQLTSWLFADMDLNLTRARSVEGTKGSDFIPLAPSLTSIGGLSFKSGKGFSGSLRYRYIKDRPANEDASLMARGYFMTDALLNFAFKKIELFVSGENIFNVKWNEAQFETESRLRNESSPVTEIHFTPGTPIFLKAGLTLSF